MTSAVLMRRRSVRALGYAFREEHLGPVLVAAAFLVATGTVAYSLGNGWNLVDSLYFAIGTLTTSSIADPDLALTDAWMKLFTVIYILVGIGILVEVGRRLGSAFIAVRRDDEHRERPAP